MATTSSATSTEDGTFTLLLFASASTYANASSLTIPAPMTISQLFEYLESKYLGIKRKVLSSSAITINLEYVDLEIDEEGNVLRVEGVEGKRNGGAGGGEGSEDVVIKKGDEVGIIPPVSSG